MNPAGRGQSVDPHTTESKIKDGIVSEFNKKELDLDLSKAEKKVSPSFVSRFSVVESASVGKARKVRKREEEYGPPPSFAE